MSDFNRCPPCNADTDAHRRAPGGKRKRKNKKFRFKLKPLLNRGQPGKGRLLLRMRQSQHDAAPPLQNTVSWSHPLLPLTRPPQPGGASSTSTATVSSTGRHEKTQEPTSSNNTSPSASGGLRHATIPTPAAVPTPQEEKDRWLCSEGQSQHDEAPPLQDRGPWIYPLLPLKQPPQPGGASCTSTCHTTPSSIANVSSEGQSQHDQAPLLQDRGPWIYPLRPLIRPPQPGGASSTSTCHTTPPSTATVSSTGRHEKPQEPTSSNNTGPSSSGGLRHATIITPAAVPTPQEEKDRWRCREGQSQHDQAPPLQNRGPWIYPLRPLTRPPQPGGASSTSTSNCSTPPSTATVSSTGRHEKTQEPASSNNTGPSSSGGLRHATGTAANMSDFNRCPPCNADAHRRAPGGKRKRKNKKFHFKLKPLLNRGQPGKGRLLLRMRQSQHDEAPPLQNTVSWSHPLLPLTRPPQPGGASSASTSNCSTPPSTATVSSTGRHEKTQEPASSNNTSPSPSDGLRYTTIPAAVPTTQEEKDRWLCSEGQSQHDQTPPLQDRGPWIYPLLPLKQPPQAGGASSASTCHATPPSTSTVSSEGQSCHNQAPPLQNRVSWIYPLRPLKQPPQPGGASSASTATVSSIRRHEKPQEPASSNNTGPSSSGGLRHATVTTPAAVPTPQEEKDRWRCREGQSQHDQAPPLQNRGPWIYPLLPLRRPPQPGGASSASMCHTTPPPISTVSDERQSQHDRAPPLQNRGPWIYPLRPLTRPPQPGGAFSASTSNRSTPPSTATVSSTGRHQRPQEPARNNNTGPSASGSLRHATVTTPAAVPTRILAIDCEMVGAGPKGSVNQLARCSIVSYEGDVVYDRFIKPPLPVTDYRTRWSGIRHRDLANAPPYAEARKEILRLLMGKVVIGHAIHNDFKVLRYSHPSVLTRDTSRIPLLNLKAGFAPNECASLKRLTKAIFNRDIQMGKKGHSSVEDARATMELYKVVEEEWERTLASRSQAR